ncbi:hypothetical protein [Chryseobacterium sp. SIMBA_029]
MEKGENKIRIYFENEGVNLNYFEINKVVIYHSTSILIPTKEESV